MPGPSSIAPQVPRNPDGEFEEEQKEIHVEISNQLDLKLENNDGGRMPRAPLFVSSISQSEPIVTRRELWSYYRQWSSFFPPS